MSMMHFGKDRYSGDGITMFMFLIQPHKLGLNQQLGVEIHLSLEQLIRVLCWEIKVTSLEDECWEKALQGTRKGQECHEASAIHLSGRKGHLFPNLELELVKEDDGDDDQNQLYQESFANRLRSVMWILFLQVSP